MLLKTTLATAVAAMITIGALGAGAADAASMPMKPVHTLACKPGSVAQLFKVKVHGKWHKVWRCVRVHPKHHMAPKPKTK